MTSMTDPNKQIDRTVLHLPFKLGDWVDADEVMFQACFAVLGDYVENELGREAWEHAPKSLYRGYRLHSADIEEGDPSGAPPMPSSDRKAIDLWLWYKEELPKIEEAYALDLSEAYIDAMHFGEPDKRGLIPCKITPNREPKFPHDYPETVKDQKLRELIDLRRALWT